MKIAVPRYKGRISPRFGFSEDVLIAEVDASGVRSEEIVQIARHLPTDIVDMLAAKGVRVMLTGGINLRDQALLRSAGIQVIWGLIGTPREAIEAFLSGRLFPGMGVCPPCRHRRRHRGGPTWM